MFGLFKRKDDSHADIRDIPDRSRVNAAATPVTREVAATLPLAAEEVVVDTRAVEGDTVRVDIRTETEREIVTAELMRDAVDVRRVPINEPVDHLPATRVEGDTTIVPVMRERLVLKRELVLVEELHITHARDRVAVEREVELRRQVPHVTRRTADAPILPDAAE